MLVNKNYLVGRPNQFGELGFEFESFLDTDSIDLIWPRIESQKALFPQAYTFNKQWYILLQDRFQKFTIMLSIFDEQSLRTVLTYLYNNLKNGSIKVIHSY